MHIFFPSLSRLSNAGAAAPAADFIMLFIHSFHFKILKLYENTRIIRHLQQPQKAKKKEKNAIIVHG